MNEHIILIHGETYDLGACEGVYDKKRDSFCIGNCSIYRSQTDFKNCKVA